MRRFVFAVVLLAACGKSYDEEVAPTTADGKLEISQQAQDVLDLGSASCSTSSSVKIVSVHNPTSAPISYQLEAPEAPFRIDDDHGGIVGPNETALLTVTATPIAAGFQVSTFAIVSGAYRFPIAVQVQGTGGALVWSSSGVDLGQVNKLAGGSTTIGLANSGTQTVVLNDIHVDAADFVVSPTTASIAPGGTTDITVKLSPGSEQKISSSLVPVVAAGSCGAPPSLPVTGERVNAEVTVSNVDFGKRDCGATATPLTMTLTNFAPFTQTWTVAPPKKFAIDGSSSGTLAAGTTTTPATATITIKPPENIASPGVIQESIAVTVTASAGGAVKLLASTVRIDVRGALLVFVPSTLNFSVAPNGSQTKALMVQNTGTDNAIVQWAINKVSGTASWSTPGATVVNAGSAVSVNETFSPASAGGSSVAKLVPGTGIFGGAKVCNATAAATLNGSSP